MGIASMSYLSLYDLTGIQPYIFGSNILQENLGGSYLVKQALDEWLKSIASKIGAELQWSGGGNAMVMAIGPDQAKQVATELSRRLHQTAPGLYVACVHQPWDGSDADFKMRREALYRQLHANKAGCWPPAAFDGAGFTTACVSTGEPAIKLDKMDKKWVGPAAKARLDYGKKAAEDLQEICCLPDDLAWTNQFDQLGRSHGEQSMLGVIHFDGNSMGQRFDKAHLLPELCELSEQVNEAGKRTLQAALNWVKDNLSGITDVNKGGFKLSTEKNDKPCFPVRPIVYGGDDITLVCDARLALDFAAELLRAWHRHTGDLLGEPAHACAGVALVRVHYPFYRAYQLAEDLCKKTKQYLRDRQKKYGESADVSALDWEFIAGAGLATHEQRRKGDLYHATSDKQEQLHARPYYVIGNLPATRSYRDWNWFRNTLVHVLQQQEETHTRFKELASVLHQGASVTRVHFDRWRDRFGLSRADERDSKVDGLWLPEPKNLPMQDGFPNNETPYLDAIELMDRILPLRCYSKNDKAESAPGESP
ncbi:MAG: hypothetical protein RKP73_17165 [Candidatus Contendobacter sp.]|nr:hypothetical protein [Candidatus Contendobacter sp.]